MSRPSLYVRITKQAISDMFDECNRLYFDNQVERPKIFDTWTPHKNTLGWTRPIVNRRTWKVSSALHVSRRYNWTPENFRMVIVHEMIHLLIEDYKRPLRWWERIFPFFIKEHDQEFIDKMNELNETYGLTVGVRFPAMRPYFKK